MAETPTRTVTFASRVIEARDRYHEETFDNEDVTCENDSCGDQHMGADTEGSASISIDVSIVGEGELQPPKIDECEKTKNETFQNKVCNKLERVFQDLCFVKAYDSSGNSMVVITQQTLMFHPPMGFTS